MVKPDLIDSINKLLKANDMKEEKNRIISNEYQLLTTREKQLQRIKVVNKKNKDGTRTNQMVKEDNVDDFKRYIKVVQREDKKCRKDIVKVEAEIYERARQNQLK